MVDERTVRSKGADMSATTAKEFLVALADDDAAAARVDQAYVAALRAEAAAEGVDVTDDDLRVALAEMVGLGDDELAEVSGYVTEVLSSLQTGVVEAKSPAQRVPSTIFGNPLGFQLRRFPS